MFNRNLAKMLTTRKVFKRKANFIECKSSINYGMKLVLCNGFGHIGEVLAASDSDSLHANMSSYNRPERNIHLTPCKYTDQTYRSPCSNSTKGLRQSTLSTDLNNMVNAIFSCNFANSFAPFRDTSIVDDFIGAHCPHF